MDKDKVKEAFTTIGKATADEEFLKFWEDNETTLSNLWEEAREGDIENTDKYEIYCLWIYLHREDFEL